MSFLSSFFRCGAFGRRAGHSLGVMLAVVALSACGEMPRPFAHDRLAASANPLVALPSGTGVTVTSAAGLPHPWSRLLALEAAEMLRGRGIPAEAEEVSSGRLGHTLVLEVRAGAVTGSGQRPLQIFWQLKAADGTTLSSDSATVTQNATLWDQAAPEAAQAVVTPVVADVTTALGPWTPRYADGRDPAPRAAPSRPVSREDDLSAPPPGLAGAGTGTGSTPAEAPPGPGAAPQPAPPVPAAPPKRPAAPPPAPDTAVATPEAKLVTALVPTVVESPGDGTTSLANAMAALMRAAGVTVTPDKAKADFSVVGRVVTEPAGPGKEKVTITWTVTNLRADAKLGDVTQQNVIPKGMLDGPWGPVALDVARAALDGIGEVLITKGR